MSPSALGKPFHVFGMCVGAILLAGDIACLLEFLRSGAIQLVSKGKHMNPALLSVTTLHITLALAGPPHAETGLPWRTEPLRQ